MLLPLTSNYLIMPIFIDACIVQRGPRPIYYRPAWPFHHVKCLTSPLHQLQLIQHTFTLSLSLSNHSTSRKLPENLRNPGNSKISATSNIARRQRMPRLPAAQWVEWRSKSSAEKYWRAPRCKETAQLVRAAGGGGKLRANRELDGSWQICDSGGAFLPSFPGCGLVSFCTWRCGKESSNRGWLLE